MKEILSLKEQIGIRNSWLTERLSVLLPALMRETEIDLWLIVAREYNDDPILQSMLPLPMVTGDEGYISPTTKDWLFIVHHLQEDGNVRSILLNGPGIGDVGSYQVVNPQDGQDEWQALNMILGEIKPQKIGLNYSNNYAHVDGLSLTAYQLLEDHIDADLFYRQVSAETLGIRWLSERIPAELTAYRDIVAINQQVIAEAYTRQVITPSQTDVQDVSWWIRQRFNELGLNAWFMPMVSILRKGQNKMRKGIILPGDVLHCDVGVRYLGLLSDIQQLAYVLRDGERAAPGGLQGGLHMSNIMQDIHFQQMRLGRTGNEVLAGIHAEANQRGIRGRVWTHPIGYHGHGAGPLIGKFNQQESVAGRGAFKLFPNTCYAMELCTYYNVPEWDGQEIAFGLEETIVFTDQASYLRPRQTEYHLI